MADALLALDKIAAPRPVKTWHSDKVLDQGQTPHCHPAGTLVRMADNTLRPIEQIQVLDRVISAEGNECAVSSVLTHEHHGELIGIRLRGLATVQCTPEHPILTQNGWALAKDLRCGDMVAVPRRTFSESRTTLYFNEVVEAHEYARRGSVSRLCNSGGVETLISAPPKEIILDKKFGRLLGLYAAEGYGDKQFGVRWAYGAHEEYTLVAETVELIREVLGAEARLQYRRNNNVICVVLGGKHWRLLFERLLGKGAENKQLSSTLDGSPQFREALLMGWIDGDGHRRRTSTMGITTSHALALQMHAIANDLGLSPVLRRRNPITNHAAQTRKVAWEVEWGVGVNPHSTLTTTATWRRVSKLEVEEFDGYVFNLEVENDHSYIADGVGVHNCVGFAFAGWGISTPVEDPWGNPMGHDIYAYCKVLDGEPGAQNGSTIRTGAKVMVKRNKIATYFFASNIDEAADYVARYGPVVLGTAWFQGMYKTGLLNNIIRPSGKLLGGHAYLWIGVDNNYATIRNSWGTSWGKNGDARILLSDLKRLFAADGEACAATERALSIGGN
jgi:hypothetical protein